MGRIEDAMAAKARNTQTIHALECQRSSSPGQWGLRQWSVSVDSNGPYNGVVLNITTHGAWHTTGERKDFALALQAGLEAARVQIIDAAIEHLRKNTAQACAYAEAEARAVLAAAKGGAQ